MSNFQIPIHDLIVTSPVFSSYKYETVICNRCEMVTCYKYETFNFSYKIFVVKICNSYLLKYETFICYKYETFTCYKYETFKFSSRILFPRHRGPGHSLFSPLNFLNLKVFSLDRHSKLDILIFQYHRTKIEHGIFAFLDITKRIFKT